MFIQDQLPWEQVNDENLTFFKAIGVDYLTINPAPICATAATAPTTGLPCENWPNRTGCN